MAFDFPSSPTIGQQYTVGTATYQWDGIAWNLVPLFVPPIADDGPPANPYNGQLWWNALNGNLYVWYVDGDSAQWVQTAGNTGAAYKTAETRNRVINGDMQVSQEIAKGTSLNTNLAFPADMWKVGFVTSAGLGFACQIDNKSIDNVVSWIRLNASTADAAVAATDYYGALHVMEGLMFEDFQWGGVNAKAAVLQFKARGAIAGTFAVSVRNYAGTRCFSKNFTFTQPNVWQDFEMAIPPDTEGTWVVGNAASLIIGFYVMLGSSFLGAEGWNNSQVLGQTGITNWLAVSNQWFDFTNVGLHRDPDNTGKAPPFEQINYADVLMQCMRYWAVMGMTVGKIYAANQGASYGVTPVPMRTTPVWTNPGTTNIINEIGVAARSITTTIAITGNWNNMSAAFNMSAGGTPGNMINVLAGAFVANARM